MWTKSENSEAIKPDAIERHNNGVIVRRNFNLVEATEEIPAHYEYEEWQMTNEEYGMYEMFAEQVAEQSDALIELAEMISEVYDG